VRRAQRENQLSEARLRAVRTEDAPRASTFGKKHRAHARTKNWYYVIATVYGRRVVTSSDPLTSLQAYRLPDDWKARRR